MNDLYQQLELNRDATLQQLQGEIKKLRRTWMTRQNNSNTEKRQLAERKMELLSEAANVFESKETRKEYDDALARQPRHQIGGGATVGTSGTASEVEAGEIEEAVEKAWNLLMDDQTVQALALATQAVKTDPEFVRGWIVLALAQQKWGDREEARDSIRQAKRRAPDNAFLYSLHGSLLDEAGEEDAALREYERAHVVDPEDTDYIGEYASALARAGQLDNARELVDQGLARHPDNPALLYLKAALLYDESDLIGAYVDNVPDLPAGHYPIKKSDVQQRESLLDESESILNRIGDPETSEGLRELIGNSRQQLRALQENTFVGSKTILTGLAATAVWLGIFAIGDNPTFAFQYAGIVAVFAIAYIWASLWSRRHLVALAHRGKSFEGFGGFFPSLFNEGVLGGLVAVVLVLTCCSPIFLPIAFVATLFNGGRKLEIW